MARPNNCGILPEALLRLLLAYKEFPFFEGAGGGETDQLPPPRKPSDARSQPPQLVFQAQLSLFKLR